MILCSTIGSRMPYTYLLTRMKSPTSSVGRIEDEGILNGSARKERSANTISRTGKKLFGYSIHHGSGAPGARRFAKKRPSESAIAPVSSVARNRISAKFIFVGSSGKAPGARRRSDGIG